MRRKKQVFDVLSFRSGRYCLSVHCSDDFELMNVSKSTLFLYLGSSVSCVQLTFPFE